MRRLSAVLLCHHCHHCRPQVQYEGVEYNLRVLELQPGPAVSVIETDIAADVGPSIETEGYLRAQAEAAAREAERQRQAQEQAEREAAEVGDASTGGLCCCVLAMLAVRLAVRSMWRCGMQSSTGAEYRDVVSCQLRRKHPWDIKQQWVLAGHHGRLQSAHPRPALRHVCSATLHRSSSVPGSSGIADVREYNTGPHLAMAWHGTHPLA